MRKTIFLSSIALVFFVFELSAQDIYFPHAGEWQEKQAPDYKPL